MEYKTVVSIPQDISESAQLLSLNLLPIKSREKHEKYELFKKLVKENHVKKISEGTVLSKLNCEVLDNNLALEVRWAVAGESIVLQLVAKLDDREYMSFGLSGEDSRSVMIGGDVVVAWVDKQTLKGHAEDYYLADKSQCSGPTGSCPDNKLAKNSNNVRLLNAAMVNGYSIVTYQRSLRASDAYDRNILTNESQAVIWAVGPLNQRNEVSFHSYYLKKDKFLNFGRPARWNCPMPDNEQPAMLLSKTRVKTQIDKAPTDKETLVLEGFPKQSNSRRRGSNRGTIRPQPEQSLDSETSPSKSKEHQQQRKRGPQRGNANNSKESNNAPVPTKTIDPWKIPPIQCYEPDDGVFYAQMGPTGGKRGYPAITGRVGWGIAYYINGLLIPEINLVRGKTYTFVVEGGEDSEISAKYHPFYITDDPVGGYAYKTPEEKKSVKIFAGAKKYQDGSLIPTGIGRLCHWTQTGDLDADDFQSFGAYQRTLELRCDPGEPGVLQWTPDENTPDTVYYQCFSHRHLGWKINVHDSCDIAPAASEIKLSIVAAPNSFQDKSDTDLEENSSIQGDIRVKPNNIIIEDKEDKEHKSTISEKEIIPSTVDPNLATVQLSNKPIPIQLQQSFFEPYFTWDGPQYALHSSNFQLKQHPHYFRPSTPLNLTYGDNNSAKVHSISTIFNIIASTTTTTTTTTTTQKPLTTSSMPIFNDNIVVATNYSNKTIIPPSLSKLSQMNAVFRRPSSLPPHYHTRPVLQYPPMKFRQPISSLLRPYNAQKFPTKKRVPKPPIKLLVPKNQPYQYEFEYFKIPTSAPIRQPLPQLIVTQSTEGVTRSPSIQTITESPKRKPDQIINVEISPQQASTEREPEIQTAPSTSFIDITPTFVHPAYNTGFKPGSVKIESGFKPIISREFQDRIDNDEPEIEYEGEKGVVNIDSKEQYEYKPIHIFEPIFVPSPTDKPKKEKQTKNFKRPFTKKRHHYTKIVVKQQRNLKNYLEEPIAAASERVDTYYLPPDNQRTKPITNVQQPSNIDIEAGENPNIKVDSPPDVVITYDGKKVSGQSLTAKLSDRSSILDQRVSKASSFIRARPQFVQFRGELPPLNLDYINKNAPHLQSRTGSLSRSLDTPLQVRN